MSRAHFSRYEQRGFTLVELLVTITVVSVVSLMLANFVVDWLRSATLAQARANLLADAQTALDGITNDIRLSGSVDQNNRWPDANAPGNQFGWQSDNQVLVLAKIATDSQNDVIFSDPAQYITEKDNVVYYVSQQKLYRRTITSDDPNDAAVTSCPPASATASCPADKNVASDVTAFSVAYYDADDQVVTPANARAVQLSVTLSTVKNGKQITADYTTRMVFRNE